MATFSSIPLGWRIPDRVHAVSCSLPTMRALRGYEEKDPGTLRQMASGYPRFMVHPFVRQLAVHLAAQHKLAGHTLWLATSARMADELRAYLGAAHVVPFAADGLHGAAHPEAIELAVRAKTFLQHTGGLLSSREAEDRLVQLGLLPAAVPEALFAGDAAAEVRRHLQRAFPTADASDIFLTSSGINAVYAAFRAVAELQAARGRTLWVQLGWLYLDTIAILKKFTATPADYVPVRDVFDRAALERLFAEKGDHIAGVITEVPTNPLIQTPDAPWLAELVRRHGARLLLDPSVASPFSVDLLPHADVVMASLTKYTASEGDVIAGVAVVNPAAPDAALLRRSLGARSEPLYSRDAARLAVQMGATEAVLARIHASVPRVVEFLEARPEVSAVHWARSPASRSSFARVARAPDAVGSMVAF